MFVFADSDVKFERPNLPALMLVTVVILPPTLRFDVTFAVPDTSRLYAGDIVPTPTRVFVVSIRRTVVPVLTLLFLTLNP